MKCGTPGPDDAAFCMKCGTPRPPMSPTAAAAAQTEGSPSAAAPAAAAPTGAVAIGNAANDPNATARPSAPTPPSTMPRPSTNALANAIGAERKNQPPPQMMAPQQTGPAGGPAAASMPAASLSSGGGAYSSQAMGYYAPAAGGAVGREGYPQPISTNVNAQNSFAAASGAQPAPLRPPRPAAPQAVAPAPIAPAGPIGGPALNSGAAGGPAAAAAAGGPTKFPGDEKSVVPNIIDGIKRLYKAKIRPLEAMYKFEEFASPALTDTDFDAKPMVLLLGQYSTGKTTFIRYLLERDFPGARIGPEPTTDRFMAIMHSNSEGIIPGNALAVQVRARSSVQPPAIWGRCLSLA
jgi:hypothetical protein